MKQNETKWNKMKQNETQWNKMKQNATQWNKMKQNETKWNKMKQNETKWNKMKTILYNAKDHANSTRKIKNINKLVYALFIHIHFKMS